MSETLTFETLGSFGVIFCGRFKRRFCISIGLIVVCFAGIRRILSGGKIPIRMLLG